MRHTLVVLGRSAAMLAAVVALQARGEDVHQVAHVEEVAPLRARLFLEPDGKVALDVEKGVWLSTERSLKAGEDMADLRAQRDSLRASAERLERERMVGLVVGVALGLAVGFGGPELVRLLFYREDARLVPRRVPP